MMKAWRRYGGPRWPRRERRGAIACAALLAFTQLSTPVLAADGHDAAARCQALLGWSLEASAIGLPTRGASVTGAAQSKPDDKNGDYCRLEGVIHALDPTASDIRFGVNLPSNWNRKAIHFGGGGYDGTLVEGFGGSFLGADGGLPIKRGFATFGSDSGHQATMQAMLTGTMAAFALNDEELANFGGAQLKKVHDTAIALIRARYGRSPRRLYFYGNSQGGHEGLTVAQRWPQDYDGVVAIHPAYDFVALQLSGLSLGQALYHTPASFLPPEKLALIVAAALRSCDALDGVADGIISNVAACRQSFQVDRLRCPSGNDEGAQCLSDAQLASVRAFDTPIDLGFSLQAGLRSFSRWPLLQGAYGVGSAPMLGLGIDRAPQAPPVALKDAFVYVMADEMVRYMVMRDASADSLHFDPKAHVPRLQQLSALIDASSPDLDSFSRRGGKLLLMHGTVDTAIAPENTIAYYDSLKARYGQAQLDHFTRFYLAPGFGHGDGAFQVSWDSLSALDDWVEHGRAPGNQVMVDSAGATAGRSRPLCVYPSWPKYRGSGDVNDAKSFSCASP